MEKRANDGDGWDGSKKTEMEGKNRIQIVTAETRIKAVGIMCVTVRRQR